MKLEKKLVRIKVQYFNGKKWKTGNLGGRLAAFPEGHEKYAHALFRLLTGTGRSVLPIHGFWRHYDHDTPVRIVKTTAYRDTTNAMKGYEGREIITHEVLAGPTTYNEQQEMRIYR